MSPAELAGLVQLPAMDALSVTKAVAFAEDTLHDARIAFDNGRGALTPQAFYEIQCAHAVVRKIAASGQRSMESA